MSAQTAVSLQQLSHPVAEDILEAMQGAEEIGGPEGGAYLDLMQAVIHEAQGRMTAFIQAYPEYADRASSALPLYDRLSR